MEIRVYNLKQGAGAEFHRLVTERSLPLLHRAGVDVVACGPSLHDENAYYLLRAYASLDDLRRSEEAFYGSDAWRRGPRRLILDCID
ncbi:MAG: NIPSNAP family protein, partial [Candidatus Limnocylindria bacterium]